VNYNTYVPRTERWLAKKTHKRWLAKKTHKRWLAKKTQITIFLDEMYAEKIHCNQNT